MKKKPKTIRTKPRLDFDGEAMSLVRRAYHEGWKAGFKEAGQLAVNIINPKSNAKTKKETKKEKN